MPYVSNGFGPSAQLVVISSTGFVASGRTKSVVNDFPCAYTFLLFNQSISNQSRASTSNLDIFVKTLVMILVALSDFHSSSYFFVSPV